jgi:hypothetical protein
MKPGKTVAIVVKGEGGIFPIGSELPCLRTNPFNKELPEARIEPPDRLAWSFCPT